MSLKRKCSFDQLDSSSTSCTNEESAIRKCIRTEDIFNNNSPTTHERKCDKNFECILIFFVRIDDLDEKYSTSPHVSTESPTEEVKVTAPQRNRRKNPSQSKFPQNNSSSSTSAASSASSSSVTIPMILNLIDSLVDEKQFDNNDENLLVTIDCLISSLKHLREKIQTINHDDTHPLNLSKPKVKQSTHDEMNSAAAAAVNLPLASALFPSQPFFPPFSGKTFLSPPNFHIPSFCFQLQI